MTEVEFSGFRAALRAWFAHSARQLPWRKPRTLYRTVVSEFMLQQTTVQTVLPHFDRWMALFPGFPELAGASAEAVLKAWEGLGYYRRARYLHALARELVKLPTMPQTASQWQSLPGIGPYTAAAIASINFGQPVAVVDGNVVRVLSRLAGLGQEFPNTSSAQRAVSPLAEQLLDPDAAGTYNEALMELGATVCLKHRPLCTVCPVLAYCQAGRSGEASTLPRIRRTPTVHRTVARVWIQRRDGALLMFQHPSKAKRLAGLHELPRMQDVFPYLIADESGEFQCSHEPHKPHEPYNPREPHEPREPSLNTFSESAPWGGFSEISRIVRSITHERITEIAYKVSAQLLVQGMASESLLWVSADELTRISLSGPHRKWIPEIWKKFK